MTAAVEYRGHTAILRTSSFNETVEVVDAMRNRSRSSSRLKNGPTDTFFEYDTFEAACSAFLSGVDGPREVIETLRESVRRRVGSLDMAAFRFDNAVMGQYLDIDSYVAGEPCHMLAAFEDLERRRERFVRIVVDIAFNGNVPTTDIRTRGAAVVALCDVLNLAGYSTEVYAVSASKARDGRHDMALVVPVQRLGDPWDIRSAAFPLCSGDFSRRLKFGVTEGLVPEWREALGSGYGLPMGTSKGSVVDLEVGGADIIVDTSNDSLEGIVRDPFAWIISKCQNLGVIGDDLGNN